MEDNKYFKRDLVKALVLTAFFIVVLLALLLLDNKNQFLEIISQRIF